jgi:hypothetical protein
MWLYRRLVEPHHSRLATSQPQSTPCDGRTDWLTDWQASYGWDKMWALPRTKTNHCHPIISMCTIDSFKLSTVTIYWWSFSEMLTRHVKHAVFRSTKWPGRQLQGLKWNQSINQSINRWLLSQIHQVCYVLFSTVVTSFISFHRPSVSSFKFICCYVTPNPHLMPK